MQDKRGGELCQTIMAQYRSVAKAAVTHCVGLHNNICEVMLLAKPSIMNNGEMYAWFWQLNLSEEMAFTVLREMLRIIRETPIRIWLDDAESSENVALIGWGIRSYNF